ncbi:Dps family protein [Actinomycetospora soli]|uniref:Dps family protein n=1 Tax=Actinomycetospora soli TaxID=2893887 RepID=UPI001E418592|nr:DNA starvation/stationary phase protection protein [Actinomycetospora soli]MCD2191393.1 DNA starvation/stationary phase protection protein [Actinomycetospora soli]
MAADPIVSPLAPTGRLIVGNVLQDTLVDLIDLSLVAKQAHWNVVGPTFRDCHLHLDELVSLARTHTDDVAERCAALGVAPDGRASTIAKTSGIAPVEEGRLPVEEVNDTVSALLASLISRMRRRIGITGEHDPVTQDLLITQTAALERAHWMWQATSA